MAEQRGQSRERATVLECGQAKSPSSYPSAPFWELSSKALLPLSPPLVY